MKARFVMIALGVALVGLIGFRISQAAGKAAVSTDSSRPPPLIRTAKVSVANVGERVSITGNVRARNEVDVFAKLPGRVESLLVDVGDQVTKGQVLAVTEHKELAWQAKVSAAQVQAAKASLEVAKANLQGAQLEFDRTKTLADGGAAAGAQLDGAQVRLSLARAQVLAAEAQLAQAEAAYGLVAQQVANSRIESPIDGVVTRRTVDLGISAGQQVASFTIQDTRTLKLESSVEAAVYARLKRGQSVRIGVDAFPGETFQGRLETLAPALDPQTRRAAIEIAIDNAGGRLLPHMFARADIELGTLEHQLVVPGEAVLQQPGGAVVFRVDGGRLEQVRPRLGPADGAVVAVFDGLREGDEVAITALGNLSHGVAVKVAGVEAPQR